MATTKLRRSWASDSANAGARKTIITGSRTEQSKEKRHAKSKKNAKTQKKRYPSIFNTPDEYWCPLSSDCDCHADEKPAEQYDSGDDSAEKSAWWYNSGDDPAGVISQL